jgi:hypothetical protein
MSKTQDFLQNIVFRYDSDDCLIWSFHRNKNGYGQLSASGKRQWAHIHICKRVHGDPTETRNIVRHSCGKGALGCINPRHLSWSTRSENEKDKILHGTSNRGSRHGMSKLNEEDVRNIKTLIGQLTHQEIASLFGVTRRNIGRILSGESWTNSC